MGNLALHSAEEPDDLRATTGTVEVPTIRDNDAALALGARPIQHHEPAARHMLLTLYGELHENFIASACRRFSAVVKVDRRIRWHYTTTILRLRIGARLTRYRNCKFHNFARTISRHADGISRYSVPPSAGPILPLI